MIKPILQISSVKNSKVDVNVADLSFLYTRAEQKDLVDFLFVVDILWNCDMPKLLGFKNQVIRKFGMVHVYLHELWFIVSGICK